MAIPRLPLTATYDRTDFGVVIADCYSKPILKVIENDMQLAAAICTIVNAMPEIEGLLDTITHNMKRISVGLEDLGQKHSLFKGD